jgi:2-polyprenyl-3-methyl-5-hydroxy-6-metoxy-1,4-benzoquinol methylase
MPIGSSMVIPYVVEQLSPRPASVLDLGIGFGMNGALVRQYCDLGYGWRDRPDRVRLIGVEGFEAYRNPTWELYDHVHVCDIARFVDFSVTPGSFDVVLMTDVIEHFEIAAGQSLLKACARLLTPRGRLVVSTPGIWFEQGAAYGNEFERHRSLWTPAMFRELGFDVLWDGTLTRGQQMIVAVRSNPA